MHKDLTFLFALLAAKATNTPVPQRVDVQWERLYKIAVLHQVENLLAYGTLEGGYDVPEEVQTNLFSRMTACTAQDAKQEALLRTVQTALEAAGADYMPIKGAVLKGMYPYSDMRFMVDTDILIRQEQFPLIAAAMEEIGCILETESNHEYIYAKDGMHLELHKSLVPSYNDDLYAYYGDGWQFAKHAGGHLYALGKEDTFVYLMTHFAKHYRDAGAGIKSVLDIWLFLRKKPDMAYCMAQFAKLNISEFAENVLKLTAVWFENAPGDDKMEAMTRFIIESGSLGTKLQSRAARAVRSGGKKKGLRLIFPSLEQMQYIYPDMKKSRLPLYWVRRWVSILGGRRAEWKTQLQQNEALTEEMIQKYHAHIKAVGLDLHNGRQ